MDLDFRVATIDEKEDVLKKIKEFWDEPLEWDAPDEEKDEAFDKSTYDDCQWNNSKIPAAKSSTINYPLVASYKGEEY